MGTNTPTAPNNTTGNEDPTKTVILVSDTGVYRLYKEQWEVDGNLLTDAAGKGIVDQLTTFGAYLSYIPPELAVGIGEVCTVVNIKAILKNNLPGGTGAASAGGATGGTSAVTAGGGAKSNPTTGATKGTPAASSTASVEETG